MEYLIKGTEYHPDYMIEGDENGDFAKFLYEGSWKFNGFFPEGCGEPDKCYEKFIGLVFDKKNKWKDTGSAWEDKIVLSFKT